MEQFAREQEARRSVEASDVDGPIGFDNVIFSGVEDTSVEAPLMLKLALFCRQC